MLTNLSQATTFALLVATPILAVTPLNEPRHEYKSTVAKRNEPGVYICTGITWSGTCYWEEAVVGFCHNYWLPPYTSFGPDKGLSCTIHPQMDCEGDNYITEYPGTNDLGFTGRSWKCKKA